MLNFIIYVQGLNAGFFNFEVNFFFKEIPKSVNDVFSVSLTFRQIIFDLDRSLRLQRNE